MTFLSNDSSVQVMPYKTDGVYGISNCRSGRRLRNKYFDLRDAAKVKSNARHLDSSLQASQVLHSWSQELPSPRNPRRVAND